MVEEKLRKDSKSKRNPYNYEEEEKLIAIFTISSLVACSIYYFL